MAFTPRLTRPTAGNKYYITKSKGGYSNAIAGKPTDPQCNVLANCVGYAFGRFNEIAGSTKMQYLKPVNAENFMQYKGNLTVGQTPKLGACMVWQKGNTLSGSDGAGHVAIVEKIISDTEVVTSESGYNASKPFWTQTRKKGDGRWGQASGYKFLGFIYNPAVVDEPVAPKATATKVSFAVGDIVTYTGAVHYSSANSTAAKNCKGGKAKITRIYQLGKSKHPYHLLHAGSGCTVYGWVDEKFLKK